MFSRLFRPWNSLNASSATARRRSSTTRRQRKPGRGVFESLEHRRVLASWTQQAELLSAGLTANDELGQTVAIEGDLAVVGAWRDDITVTPTSDEGKVFVFQRTGSTWNQIATLVASDGAPGDRFGSAVAISGGTIVVSAIGDDVTFGDEGSVYVFEPSGPGTWAETAHLLPVPDFVGQNTVGENFGESVAIEGNTIVVGARSDNDASGVVRGSAYVFKDTGSGWTVNPPQKLLASDGAAGDRFGFDVDIFANRIVVGAPFDNGAASNDGSVYVFDRPGAGNPFAEVAKIVATGDQSVDDEFGTSVAVEGSTVLIGAPKENTNGAAYVFTGGGAIWTQQAKLLPPSGSLFGTAVDLQGNLAVVGATGGVNGSAFAFTQSGSIWGPGDLINATDSIVGDQDFFGQSVALDGGFIVVGSRLHDHTGPISNSGSAYIFVDPNDAPVNSVPGAQSLNEGSTLTFSALNGNAISIGDVDAFGAAMRVTLSATNGTLTLGDTTGLTFNVGTGTGDTTMTFDGTIAAINAALDGTVFAPTDADYFGPASVDILTDDLGNTGTGGPQTDSDSVGITVDAVNDAPTFLSAANHTSNEDGGAQTVAAFATASVGPANESGQSLTYNITSITNFAMFAVQPSIAPDGTLTYTAAADANGSATVTVEVQDDGGTANGGDDTSAPAMFTITVNPLNDAPTANAQSVNVSEDGQVTITLSGSDVETADANLTFTVTSLPTTGALTFGGVDVQIGDAFAGPPALVFEPAAGSGATSAAFDFTVTDRGDPDNAPGDPAQTSAAATVTINVVPAVADATVTLIDGILRVGGTATGGDTLLVDRIGSTIRVSINGTISDFPLASIDEIRVWGRDGNDTIVIDSGIFVDTLIDAGNGNDLVYGGSGSDLIFGGNGVDLLFGNAGNDMLIGGDGFDLLVGGAGHDVLVAGSISPLFTAAMLRDVSQAWAADRTAAEGIDDGTLDESAVDDDFDILSGGSGADWFIINLGDWVIDYRRRGANADLITYV